MSPISTFAGGLTAALVSLAFGSAGAEPEHNFVPLYAPPAAPGAFYQPVLVDLASARRDGDVVTIDRMEALWNFRPVAKPASPSPILTGLVLHVRLSCAWWTLGAPVADTDGYDADGNPLKGLGRLGMTTKIMDASDPYVAYLDKVCAGEELGSASGFASVQAAMDWARPHMILSGHTLIASGPGRREPPTEAAWMKNDHPHRFFQIAAPDRGGATLYLDLANLMREGTGAGGLSLLILGAQDQRANGDSAVVALRRVAYDCVHLSMTIEGQARWDRYGDYLGRSEAAFHPRSASVSAATAAEISAACSKVNPESGKTYASIDDAWADARNNWPPRPERPWKVSCVWEALRSDARNTMSAAIIANKSPNLNIAKDALSAILDTCDVPRWQLGVALNQLNRYAYRQTALEYLRANQGLSEEQLSQAWLGMKWRDSQQVIKVQTMLTAQGRAAVDGIIAKAAASLGISTADSRRMFDNFIEAEAWFET